MEWLIIGDVANVLQLSLTLKLITAIVNTAKSARMHKRNCRQFAQHLKLIGKLLEQLKPQDVEDYYSEYRDTREPLEHLAKCLKKGLNLVENCRDKSYFYLIAMGWHIVAQFKEIQAEIDKYLRLIPLISLVENHREKIKEIERDRREYTLDAEDRKILKTVLKDSRTVDESVELSKSLSRSYPEYCIDGALREEKKKLDAELRTKQKQMNLDEVDVIEHLLEITKSVNVVTEEERAKSGAPTHSRTSTMDSIDSGMHGPPSKPGSARMTPQGTPAPGSCRAHPTPFGCPSRSASVGYPPPRPPLDYPASAARAGYPVPHVPAGYPAPLGHGVFVSPAPHGPRAPLGIPYSAAPSPMIPGGPVGTIVANSPFVPTRSTNGYPRPDFQNGDGDGQPQQTTNELQDPRKWHNGLFDCCMEPFVCVSTFLYPCGTFASIATVVTDGETSQEMACHDLAFHSLYLGCCCLTCWYRRKLRKRFNIPGGTCDDCWAHVLCCCCALVQEWREIQACEEEEGMRYPMKAPSQLTMESYSRRLDPGYQFQERYSG